MVPQDTRILAGVCCGAIAIAVVVAIVSATSKIYKFKLTPVWEYLDSRPHVWAGNEQICEKNIFLLPRS